MPICKKTNSEYKKHSLDDDDQCIYHKYRNTDKFHTLNGSELVYIIKNKHVCARSLNHVERLIIMKFPDLVDELISLNA